MKRIVGTILFLFISALSIAQQLPNTNQYLANRYLLSPSFAGQEGQSQLFLAYQSSWNNFEGAPKTSFFTSEFRMNDNVWLGVEIISDNAGIINNTYGHLSYTHRLEVNYDQMILFGIWGSMFQNKINLTDADLSLIGNDPVFNNQNELSGFSLNAGASLVYQWKDGHIGVMVPYFFSNKDIYIQNDAKNIIELYSQFVVHASYKFRLNYEIEVEPIIVYRNITDYSSQIDLSLMLFYRENYWLGYTYRNLGKMAVSVGGKLSDIFTFNYTFEFVSKSYMAQPSSTHEVSIGFKLPQIVQQKKSRWRRNLNNRSW